MAKKIKEKKEKTPKVNPFDIKYSIKKGQKNKDNVKAVSSVGKPKAILKREKTIGAQYNRLGIVNEICDARVGENRKMTKEEKSALRYVELKKQKGKKKFNLEDDDYDNIDDEFIPQGKDIKQIQRFEKLNSDDDDDEDNGMDKDVMAIANFGGGKLNTKIQGDDGKVRRLTRKEIFHEILAKSKEVKLIKQVAKDEVEVMTDTLDEKFRLIRDKGVFTPLTKKISEVEKKTVNDYDEIYGTLLFEGKQKAIPQVSERIKAEKEAKKLKELEEQRLKRMNDEADPIDEEVPSKLKKKKKVQFDDQVSISFTQEGKSKVIGLSNEKIVEINPDEEVDIYDDDEEEGDVEDMEEDDEFEDEVDDENEEEVEGEDEYEEDDEKIEENVDIDESEEEASEETEEKTIEKSKSMNEKEKVHVEIDLSEPLVRQEIPYAFDVPQNYKSFVQLYASYTDDQLFTVTERLIKCNHPSLKRENKLFLGKVFKFCLRFYDELAQKKAFKKVKILLPILRKYLEVDTANGAKMVRSLLQHKRKNYLKKTENNVKPTATFDLISFFVLVLELFPTSDAFHSVCTPTLYFLIDVLKYSLINSLQSIGITMMLINILTKWIIDSRRYIPELIRSTRLLLELAVTKKGDDYFNDPYCYSNVSRRNGFIDCLIVKQKTIINDTVLDVSMLFETKIEDENAFKCLLLKSLFNIIDKTIDVYKNNELSFGAIFEPQLKLLERIAITSYPVNLADNVKDLIEKIVKNTEQFNKRTQRQRVVSKKVHMVKLLDPVIDEVYDVTSRRRTYKLKPEEEEKIIKKKIRRERRGAMKELRLDAKYISSVQHQKNMQVKKERDEKTRKIIAQLQGQESEYKKNHPTNKKF